jgi:hypothetical protein
MTEATATKDAAISPLPWKRDGWGNVLDANGKGVTLSGFRLSTGAHAPEPVELDAFIVRAVNSHEALVEALEAAKAWMNNGPQLRSECMAQIDAAIALAKNGREG